MPPAAPPEVSNLVGLLVPPRSVQSTWRAISPSRLMTIVEAPGSVNELVLFMLPGARLPEGKGLLVHYSIVGHQNWSTLGGLLPPRCSSVVLRPGWSSTPEIAAAPAIQLGLSLEDAATVLNFVQASSAKEWDKAGFAQLVARDVFMFLSSFSKVTPGGEMVVIPPDALDRWVKKFQERFRRDPNFLLNKT